MDEVTYIEEDVLKFLLWSLKMITCNPQSHMEWWSVLPHSAKTTAKSIAVRTEADPSMTIKPLLLPI